MEGTATVKMLTLKASLLLLMVCRMDAFVVTPSRTLHSTTSNKPLSQLSFSFTSHMMETIPASVLVGDASIESAVAAFDPVMLLGGLTAVFVVMAPLLLAATEVYNDEDIVKGDAEEAEPPRRLTSKSSRKRGEIIGGAVGRRGTLMTLLGGAVSLAASDVLLGAVTSSVFGGSVLGGNAAISSSVYGAEWSALYQRIATLGAKHEAAAAVSPELVSWIARSPAFFANPELRAWVAAQRAFHKSRQILGAAVTLEEGLATAGAVAAAAAATKSESTAKDKVAEADVSDVVVSGGAVQPAENYELTDVVNNMKTETNSTTSTIVSDKPLEEEEAQTE